MTTIMIDARLGITIDNLPEEVFQEIQGNFDQCEDGGIKFNINNNVRNRIVDIIRRAAMTINRINVEIETIGITIVKIKPSPIGVTPEVDRTVEHDAPVEDEPERRTSGMVPVETIDNLIPLGRESSVTMIAATLENEVSNLAKNLQEKQARFTREWTKVLNLKREIDEAMTPIENNPIIEGVMSQINEIREADNLVDEIFLVDGYVVAKTMELVTDNTIEGSRRKIGRMLIKIDLKSLIGSGTSESRDPVSIRNLDHKYYDGSTHWECAHVKSVGVPCWGTAWEMLFSAMVSRDIHSVMEVVIRFIKNPNPADPWGEHIKYWPRVDND